MLEMLLIAGGIIMIIALLIYIRHLRKDNEHWISEYAEAKVEWFYNERRLVFQIDELLKRDQVEAYTALEQGMTELGEGYEADRLDMLEKIERLTMERDFLQAQTGDVIEQLTAQLAFLERAQKLHVDTILSYQKEKEEKIQIPVSFSDDV